jgi:hypothetical protein
MSKDPVQAFQRAGVMATSERNVKPQHELFGGAGLP